MSILVKRLDSGNQTADLGVILNTPAQVHFYRNIIKGLERKGIGSHVAARDYGETVPLLEELGIDHFIYSRPTSSKINKMVSMPSDVVRATSWLKKFDIGLITGFGVIDVFTSVLRGVPNLIFSDSEPMIDNSHFYSIQFKAFMPFVDTIITPSYFRQDLGKNHLKVKSLKEMAYLHPSYFSPDDSIYDLLSISKGEPYVILRFNAFDAVHDLGIGGFSDDDKRELVRRLEKHCRTFISSEKGIPSDLHDRIIKIPRSRIHDALYYANMLVTDTQTMATEAAILGTPTVRCNSFVGPKDMGNFIELEKNYGLIINLSHPQEAIEKAEELIKNEQAKAEWGRKRSKLLNDYVDISALMTWLIENYPLHLEQFIDHPEMQSRFTFGKTASNV